MNNKIPPRSEPLSQGTAPIVPMNLAPEINIEAGANPRPALTVKVLLPPVPPATKKEK